MRAANIHPLQILQPAQLQCDRVEGQQRQSGTHTGIGRALETVVLSVPFVSAVPWADLKASYPFRGRCTLTPIIRRGWVSMSKRVGQTGKTLGPYWLGA